MISEVLKEVKLLMRKARKAEQRAEKVLRDIYQILESIGVDLEAPTSAENADNLGDAISCYIQYGEYSIEDILLEVKENMQKRTEFQNANFI